MSVRSPLTTWLRLEGLTVLALGVVCYWSSGASWWLFALLFLVPDVSFAGYLAGPRVGAVVYNLAHTYTSPLALALAAWIPAAGSAGSPFGTTAWLVAVIWIAHIGFDRALGYGLKYPTAFQDTHLGRIGKA